jgi:HEAT repeat protein
MNLFNTNTRNLLACVTLLIAGAFNTQVFAQVSGLTDDGWHTWRVPAVSSAPEMCCFSWKGGTGKRQGCNLDSRSGGFSTSSEGVNSTGDLQVFVHVEKGDVTEIRALSASCPVTSDSAILDLGPVAARESIAWLKDHIEPNLDLASEAIMAAAVHDGKEALELLLQTANSNDEDNREDAIFWMAQVRVDETSVELKTFIFDNRDPDIREHAAFAYAQSEADDIAEVLIRQGRNDEDPDVRSQAWFWLAQSEAPESEDAIMSAMREDNDDDVREEAVFALSQLPDDRAVKALAGILEDSSFDMEIREQALFWLAQAESDEAFEYIDRILSDN